MTILYNNSKSSSLPSFVFIQRILQKIRTFDLKSADFRLTYTPLFSHISAEYVSQTIPFFITFGVLNICVLFLIQIVNDHTTEQR